MKNNKGYLAMKDINYYMKQTYGIEINPVEEDDGERYFQLVIPELPGFKLYGDSESELLKDMEDAKREWFLASLEEGRDIPEPKNVSEYSGRITLRIPKYLHEMLSRFAKREEVSLNTAINFLLTKNFYSIPAEKMSQKFDSLAKAINKKSFSKNEYHITYNAQSSNNPEIKSIDKTDFNFIGMQAGLIKMEEK